MTAATLVSDARPVANLARKATSSVGWNVAGFLFRSAAGFVVNLLLARLLGPKPFGVVALAMVVIALGNLLVDSGLGVQLIQKASINTAEIQTVFGLQLILGTSIGLLLFVASPLAASAFGQPEIRSVIRVLALVLIVQSAGQTSAVLLRREFRFKQLQQIQIASYLIGYGLVGIPVGLLGGGVWTLVAAQLSQAGVSTVMSWLFVRHSLVPRLGSEARQFLGFGSRVAGSNVICWLIGALPSLVIGRSLGMISLGLYNRASTLVAVPLTAVASSFQTVALSLYSRLQDKQETAQRAFLAIIAVLSLIAFPAFLLVAGTAKGLVAVLLGTKWSAAAALLVPLAFAMPFDAVASMSGPILVSRGRPGMELRIQVVTAISGGILLCYTTLEGWSLPIVAWGLCLGFYVVRACSALIAVKHVLELSWHAILHALMGGVLLGAVIFITVRATDFLLNGTHLHPAVRAFGSGAAGLLAAGTLTLSTPKQVIHPDVPWLFMGRNLPIPGTIHSVLSRVILNRL